MDISGVTSYRRRRLFRTVKLVYECSLMLDELMESLRSFKCMSIGNKDGQASSPVLQISEFIHFIVCLTRGPCVVVLPLSVSTVIMSVGNKDGRHQVLCDRSLNSFIW